MGNENSTVNFDILLLHAADKCDAKPGDFVIKALPFFRKAFRL
jgi:hypothetical protein